MRKRFNTNRICSSENYHLSISVHRKYLLKNHTDNKEYFEEIKVNCKLPYTLCFGKKIKLTQQDVEMLGNSVTIYWE